MNARFLGLASTTFEQKFIAFFYNKLCNLQCKYVSWQRKIKNFFFEIYIYKNAIMLTINS